MPVRRIASHLSRLADARRRPAADAAPGRRRSRPFRSAIVALAMGLVLLAGIAPAPVAAGTFTRDTYFNSGYEHQIDSRTCTAAGTAMMLNFIARHDLGLSQSYILRWEQTHDTLDDRVQRGSDPLGWARALTYFSNRTGVGSFTYRWESYSTESIALKHAAKVIAQTGMPVGLLVSHGQHAIVMTGFESTADPRRSDFTLLNVWISDPNGDHHRRYSASDTPLNTYLELDSMYDFYDQAWYGRYVIVARPI